MGEANLGMALQELVRVHNQQASALKAVLKDLSAHRPRDRADDPLWLEMSRLDDELSWSQRELARRTSEARRLYAQERSRARALRDATLSLMDTLSLEPLLQQVLDAALRSVPAATGAVLLLAEGADGPTLRVRAVLGPSLEPAACVIRDECRCARVVFDTAQAAACDDEEPCALLRAVDPRGRGPRSVLSVPLGPASGVGVVLLVAPGPGRFAHEDLDAAQAFGFAAGLAIRNGLLHEAVERLTVIEPLTGLHNRRGLSAAAEREYLRTLRAERPFAVLALDLDHFRRVVDGRGREAADRALSEVAAALRRELRQTDLVGRWGYDEFVIVLPECGLASARASAEALRGHVSDVEIHAGGERFGVTVSVGVSARDPGDRGWEDVLSRAREGLREAKDAGRDAVCVAGS